MKTSFDVAVIGGGIIGASIAYHLAKENMDVAVFEADRIGRKATGAAAGMLGAHSEADDLELFYPFARESQLAYASLEKEVHELCGLDFEVKEGGIYKLAYSQLEKQALSGALSLPTVDWVDAAEVHKAIPEVSETIIGAAYIQDDVNLIPNSVARGFCRSVQVLGGSIYEYTKVEGIERCGTGYEISTTRGKFHTQYVVVASGVWSSPFFKQAGFDHQLYPIKGEIISVKSDQLALKATIFHNGSYIVPRRDGTFVIGATMVANDWSEQCTIGGIEALITKAKLMLPGVTDMRLHDFWAGLRPQTFDTLPFIGKHPDHDGLIFATGHSRNGILLAPVTGMMVRDLLLGREVNPKWVEAFKLERSESVYA
ncbi:glycine oxidase ThiO [Bacillus sp. T3]|uniref:glycine oxidase ThiO n=1 Tax=Bacillus sp. T3 TaxID=467262 RepID=UPI002982B505|nr:glycine oxidase ThiO [Bacillus sp. T3]